MAPKESPLTPVQAAPKRRTQAHTLQERIETALIQGEFKPGERLDESGLAQRFGVSRTPVRDALNSLTATGLVEKRQHAGVVVANPPLAEVMEMFEVMAVLEAFAASQAARRATGEDLTALKKTHKICLDASKKKDPALFFIANQVFHEHIYEAAHNSVLQKQILALDKRLAPYRRLVTYRPGRIEESMQEHAAILDAIEQNALETASHVMEKHLTLLAEDALTLARASDNHQRPSGK